MSETLTLSNKFLARLPQKPTTDSTHYFSLVSLVNLRLGLLPDIAGEPVALQRILGIWLAPFVWLLGIPWTEAMTAGSLLGTKTIPNEFIAYLNLAGLPDGALADPS